ncbi:MAG: hypothetical protein GXO86_08665 [Chlorobi bacterium]|nr:hypothetical protein [Chlorobiota bacterium]
MIKKFIPALVLLVVLPFVSNRVTALTPPVVLSESDPCVELGVIYDQALNYFKGFRGEKQEENGVFGKVTWYDYRLKMWEAQDVKLWAKDGMGTNKLVYTWCETGNRESAVQCYQELVDRFASCSLKGYLKQNISGTTYVREDHFIDERDNGEWIHIWPQFIFELSGSDNEYKTQLTIIGKWAKGN